MINLILWFNQWIHSLPQGARVIVLSLCIIVTAPVGAFLLLSLIRRIKEK